MAKLKVGIIGLGGIARSHCDAIAHLDHVEVVAVADLFEEKRREYMETYDIPRGYASHTELLEDVEVEAVAVVLGHQLHHRLTVDACNAGKTRAGREADGPQPAAVRPDDRGGSGQQGKADGRLQPAFLRNQPQGQGDPRLGRTRSDDHDRLLHVQELGLFLASPSVPQPLPRGRHVADQRRARGGPPRLAHGRPGHLGRGLDRAPAPTTRPATIRRRPSFASRTALLAWPWWWATPTAPPTWGTEVICANGTLRFSQHGGKYVQVGHDEKWEDVPFDDPPTEMYNEWKTFAESIAKDIEPPHSRPLGPLHHGDPVRRRAVVHQRS